MFGDDLLSFKAKISKKVDEHRNEIVELLQKLVKVKTPVPPGENYLKAVKIVQDKCESLGWNTNIYEAPEKYLELSGRKAFGLEGPRVNLVSEIKGAKERPVAIFNAHLDVVPVSEGWSEDPFSAIIKDNSIYGRGSSDNKAGVVAEIFAMQVLQELDVKLGGDVLLTATVDEEIGGIAGLYYLFEEGIVKGDYGISLDGSITRVGIAANGRLRWRIHTFGKAVHSSRAFQGINAIEKMAKIVLAIQEYGKVLQQRYTTIPAAPEVGKPFLYPIAQAGVIQGGLKANIVPDKCTLAIDRRVSPDETVASASEETKKIVEAVRMQDPEIKYEIEEISTRDPWYTLIDHPLPELYFQTANEFLSETIVKCGSAGSSDASFMVNEGEMPSISLGPGRMENNVHGIDEHMPIDDLINLVKVHALAITRLMP
jgi:succinyl-diaminopimelate desuccinylase